jgi:hypothetical protein
MNSSDLTTILNAKISPARGGRRPAAPLTIGTPRELTEEDLSELENPTPLGTAPPVIQRIRSTHHRIAQLVAEGRKGTEISLIMGYSQSRISILQSDPAFQELVAFYKNQQNAIFSNVQERLADLGMAATEEIRERLEENPGNFTTRDLLEVQKAAFDRSIAPPKVTQNPSESMLARVMLMNEEERRAEASNVLRRINQLVDRTLEPEAKIIDNTNIIDVDIEE